MGENGALVCRWFEEVWGNGRAEAIDELLAPGATLHDVSDDGEQHWDAEGFRNFFSRMRGTFGQICFTIEEVVEEGDKVAVRWLATMCHVGEGLGIPPTNRNLRITGMSFAHLRGGRIVEGWSNWDVLGMQRQLTQPM